MKRGPKPRQVTQELREQIEYHAARGLNFVLIKNKKLTKFNLLYNYDPIQEYRSCLNNPAE
jgi:hypothetical protein